ncbi:MAG: sulfurtransferase [Rhodothermaceae bacterium]|nr:sulfurtransferase [Rhodothermaceae bacterium]
MGTHHNPRFEQLVDQARARITETDVATIRARQERGEAFTLIDVREESEWQRGHLPAAVHLGKGIIERDAETHFPDLNTPLVLYCGGGYRSALAAEALQRMGYTNVASMDGGYRGWTTARLPIVTPDAQ